MSSQTQIKVLSELLRLFREKGVQDRDDYASKLVETLTDSSHERNDEKDRFLRKAYRIRTNFYRVNRIKKSEFLFLVYNRLSKYSSQLAEGQVEDRRATSAKHVTVDDIDSFRAVQKIPSPSVRALVPLTLLEQKVKEAFMEIIGEQYYRKDRGGEGSDLYSTNLVFEGRRTPSAFAFKGRGTQGLLTVAKLGTNGDQIISLFEQPARIFLLQYGGQIHPNVYKEMYAHASTALKKIESVAFCVIDGIDTARILVAYAKLGLE